MAAGGRRRSGIIIIVLALLLIVIVGGVLIVFQVINSASQSAAPKAAQTVAAPQLVRKIVIVTQPISRGSVITSDKITLIDIPQSSYTEGAFYTDVAQVADRKRAKYDLPATSILTPASVVDKSSGSIPAATIPAGRVAIAIPLDRMSAVAYAIQAGDHVSVLASFMLVDIDSAFQTRLPNMTGVVLAPGPAPSSSTTSASGVTTTQTSPYGPSMTLKVIGGAANPTQYDIQGRIEQETATTRGLYVIPGELESGQALPRQRPRLVSQSLITDCIVLQVGEFSLAQAEPQAKAATPAANAPQTTPTPEPPKPNIITLVVQPQDAVTLNYLMLAKANLNLVLRNPSDAADIFKTEAVTLQFILDQYNIPVPAKLPYGMEPRLDNSNQLVLPNR
jgi:pilus assembly protein CpaB